MLDQNTDRMWYVIGAVLVGAAILLLLNGTAPDLFAQVAGTYEEKTEEAADSADQITVGGVRPNLLLGTHEEWREYGASTYVFGLGLPSEYRSAEEMGLEPGDVVTFTGDYRAGDSSFAPRINFSPVPHDTDDHREMSRYGDIFTGNGRFSFTVEVPEHTEHIRVMLSNRNGEYGDEVQIRQLRLVEEMQ